MKIEFFGAARTVTGSKHLITTASGFQVLLDCGLFQGIGTTEMNLHFGFDPARVNALVLSHAHIDHCGLLPRLVRQGFSGPIYCTPGTRDLVEILLLDSAHIQETDLERVNKRRRQRGELPLEPLYDTHDVQAALQLFRPIDYHESFSISPEVSVRLYDAGHILGSTSVYLTIQEGGQVRTVWFTADIGRPEDQILRSPEAPPQADFILCESTYGDKLHEPEPDMKRHLYRVVKETCQEQGGKVIIPAFAVDRTQELVYALDQLESEGLLPRIPVYVDSPLSVRATQVMRDYDEYFNPELLAYLKRYGDPFNFPNLHYITDVEDSKAINAHQGPAIIISSSGMAEAGRIKHHIRNNIGDARNTILLVGYAGPETLGGALKRGDKEVRIFGEAYEVRCRVEVMDAFSAHADYAEIIRFLARTQDHTRVQRLFLVHGDYDVQLHFRDTLASVGWQHIEIPARGEGFELS